MHLVMFDVDGTLVDNDHVEATLYNKAIKDVLDIDVGDTWADCVHVTDPGILVEVVHKQQNRTLSEKEYDAVRDYFSDLLFDTIMEKPDTATPTKGGLALFNELMADDNVQVAVATGAWGPGAALKLGTAGYDIKNLVMATGDDEAERTEIMMASYERAIERSGVEQFETITYLGDAKWDVAATAQLGWRFIGVGEKVKDVPVWLADFADADATHKALNLVAPKAD